MSDVDLTNLVGVHVTPEDAQARDEPPGRRLAATGARTVTLEFEDPCPSGGPPTLRRVSLFFETPEDAAPLLSRLEAWLAQTLAGSRPAERRPESLALGAEEIGRLCQWFNALQDVSPTYLQRADHVLVRRLSRACGRG